METDLGEDVSVAPSVPARQIIKDQSGPVLFVSILNRENQTLSLMQPAPGVETGSISRHGFTLCKCRPDLHVLVDNGQGSNDFLYLIVEIM